jgi:hypothetical protein
LPILSSLCFAVVCRCLAWDKSHRKYRMNVTSVSGTVTAQ